LNAFYWSTTAAGRILVGAFRRVLDYSYLIIGEVSSRVETSLLGIIEWLQTNQQQAHQSNDDLHAVF
jgi:hypothetical protein